MLLCRLLVTEQEHVVPVLIGACSSVSAVWWLGRLRACVCVFFVVWESFIFFFLTKVNFSVANSLLQNIPVVFLFVCLSCREKDGVKNLSSRLYSGVSYNLVCLLYCGNEGASFCFFLCKNLDRFFGCCRWDVERGAASTPT